MSEDILIINCSGTGQPDPKVGLLVESLRGKGVTVHQIDLKDNHRLILDRLERGERPFVIKSSL